MQHFFNLFNYLKTCGYLNTGVLIHHYHYLFCSSNCPSTGHWKRLQVDAPSFLKFVFSILLLSGTTRCFRFIYIFSALIISPRSSVEFLSLENGNQNLVSSMFIATTASLLPSTLTRKYLNAHTYIFYLSIHMGVGVHKCVCVYKLMSSYLKLSPSLFK